MGENKQVSIARHGYFYKIFFLKHQRILETFIELSFTELRNGYTALNVFYSSYSYYLKDDPEDNEIKLLLKDKIEKLNNNKSYEYLKRKVNINPKKLTLTELKELNTIYHNTIKDILTIFEDFVHKFAPSDILPNITEAHREYERNIVFVLYDTFYESLYNIHAKISDLLLNFNVLQFKEVLQVISIFFYGYSYYLQKSTIVNINSILDKLFNYYNDDEFLLLYLKSLNENVTSEDIEKLKVYRDDIFNNSLNVFELINQDLPKTNLMPKKAEKILIDDTLI